MKEKIHDTAIIEAYENHNDECPMCTIEKSIEKKYMELFFDEMVMDVDFNLKFMTSFSVCGGHLKKLYAYPDKLGLAIIVQKLLLYKEEELELDSQKQGFMGKLYSKSSTKRESKPCYLCTRVKENMKDYLNNLEDLWKRSEEFKKVYSHSKGMCIEHHHELISLVKDKRFKEITLKLQNENMKRLQEEIEWFIQKFDYRFHEEPWKTSKDSLPRGITKLIGKFEE